MNGLIILQKKAFYHWFTFSSGSHNYETSSSSKGLIKDKTRNTKKYGSEAMTNNAISSWNNIQKIILSHVQLDLSYSKLKFFTNENTL